MPIPTDAEIAEFVKSGGRYRLECSGGCGVQLDGIKKIPPGWSDIHERRSLKEALSTYDDIGDPDPPPGYSLLDWETHAGLCPECTKVEAEEKRKVKRRKPAKK